MSDVVDMVKRRTATESPKVFEQRRTMCEALIKTWETIISTVVPRPHQNEYLRKARNEAISLALINATEETLDVFAENDGTYSVEQLTIWTRRSPDVMRTICGKYADTVLPS